MPARTFELEAERVKLRILRLAHRENWDSAILVAALADVVGLTAATLDLHSSPMPFETRIDDFVARAKGVHQRTLQRASTALQRRG